MPNPQAQRSTHPPDLARTLDLALDRALASKPALHIPAYFASHVARLAAAQPVRPRRRWLGWGPRLAIASAALLLALLFGLAPHTVPSLSNLAFDGELLGLAELGGLLLFTHQFLRRD